MNKSWKKGLNYLKWGYANYINVASSFTSNIILVHSILLHNKVPYIILIPVFLSLVVPLTMGLGKWDYGKGSFPEWAKINAKNSPPARDMYRALYYILKDVEENEEIKELKLRLKEWGCINEN